LDEKDWKPESIKAVREEFKNALDKLAGFSGKRFSRTYAYA